MRELNIGPLVRSIIGDSKQGESKSLELKTGQVVRGTVLSVSEDGQEAVIQVQGVKLHAALETPLQQGQTTLLQVKQPNEDGTMVLKPMGSLPQATLSGGSLTQVIQSMGLEDNANNRELITQMQNSGIPLTKENVTLLGQLLNNKPAQVPISEWIQSAGIAIGRGLPVTPNSVAGLHQAIFGPPFHELLSNLEQNVANWLSQQSKGTEQAVNSNSMLSGSEQQSGTRAPISSSSVPTVNTAGELATSTPTKADGQLIMGTGQAGGGEQKAAEVMLKLQQVLGRLRDALSQETLLQPHSASDADSVPDQLPLQKQNAEGTIVTAGKAHPEVSVPNQGQPSTVANADSWVGRVLKLLGAEHEQQVRNATSTSSQGTAAASPNGANEPPQAQAVNQPHTVAPNSHQAINNNQAPVNAATMVLAEGGDTDGAVDGKNQNNITHNKPENVAQTVGAERPVTLEKAAIQNTSSESLKGLLLQLADAEDLPAPLKEVVKQVVQQLTGQQLLLNTDRTTPFAHVTMFLPFFGPDGQQTAAVHIESRRGRKGELDPANCRLWFDLQMKALGQIMVDVQVADKKVLLKIYSEHEAMGQFLEARKEEVETALETTGYQLLSFKTEQLIHQEPEDVAIQELGMAVSYTPTVYKGVDYRV